MQPKREEASDLSPLAIGTLTLLVMLVYFWLSDALFPDDTTGLGWSSAQITGMVADGRNKRSFPYHR